MIGFISGGSTPLPAPLVAQLILGVFFGRTPAELVELGYGKMTLDDIGELSRLCGSNPIWLVAPTSDSGPDGLFLPVRVRTQTGG